jgi:hypothetical protein
LATYEAVLPVGPWRRPRIQIDTAFGRLVGRVSLHETGGVLLGNPSKEGSGKARLSFWLHLLAASAAGEVRGNSHLVSRDRIRCYPLIESERAKHLLNDILTWAQERDTPASILPRTLQELATSLRKEAAPDEAIDRSRRGFRKQSDKGQGGEGTDPEVARWLELSGREPDWDELVAVAESVFLPMVEQEGSR